MADTLVDTLDLERLKIAEAPDIAEGVESDSIERLEFAEAPAEQTRFLNLPILRTFALVAGGGLSALGLGSLMPWFTRNETLLGLFHTTPLLGAIYLLCGLAGLAAWRWGREAHAFAFAAALVPIFLLIFSDGNIAYGNAVGMHDGTAPESMVLGFVALRQLPQFIANGFNISLAMVAFFAAAAAAMMAGARNTLAARGPYIRVYRSRTRIRTTDAA